MAWKEFAVCQPISLRYDIGDGPDRQDNRLDNIERNTAICTAINQLSNSSMIYLPDLIFSTLSSAHPPICSPLPYPPSNHLIFQPFNHNLKIIPASNDRERTSSFQHTSHDIPLARIVIRTDIANTSNTCIHSGKTSRQRVFDGHTLGGRNA